ncbi:hypothetical protein EDB70_11417 [Vibrio crassostreae]|uniref:phage tail protein n=1 Tax=Vibrio crassostreae TaxID=246167 RepID=UPI0010D4A094|nr:phage tail protein [Vibrio crassostreae]TCV22105.1 hypothetical protein EDB70_11417 [Vibrio crassostreae]
MSDFTAIGQLVTEARNLLDSIKGGAIRKMETAFDALKSSIASEWNGIKTKMNNEALAAIGRVDTETVRSEMGFIGLNYNGDYRDTVSVQAPDGTMNTWPVGLSWSSVHDFNKYFKAEVLRTYSGSDPATRPEVIKSLLDACGIGRSAKHFYGSLGVLKLTIKELPTDINDFRSLYLHVTADYRIPNRGGVTMMNYEKKEGDWVRRVIHRPIGGSGTYDHFDAYPFSGFSDGPKVGDDIYIALPVICAGIYPESKPHFKLPNVRNWQKRDDNNIKATAGI